MIWDELQKKWFKNELFTSLHHVVDRLCDGLNYSESNHQTVKSITA